MWIFFFFSVYAVLVSLTPLAAANHVGAVLFVGIHSDLGVERVFFQILAEDSSKFHAILR